MPDNPFEQLRSHLSEQDARDAEEAQLQEAERAKSELLEHRAEQVHKIGVLLSELKALMVVADAHENLRLVGDKNHLKRLENSDNPDISRAAKAAGEFIPHAEAAEKALVPEEEYVEDQVNPETWKNRIDEVVSSIATETEILRELSGADAIQDYIHESEEAIEQSVQNIRKQTRNIFPTPNTSEETAAGTFLADALIDDYMHANFPMNSEVSIDEITALAPEFKLNTVRRVEGETYRLERATQSTDYVPYPVHDQGLHNALRKVYDTVRTFGEKILTNPIDDVRANILEGKDPKFQDAIEHYAKVKQFEELQTARNNLMGFFNNHRGFLTETNVKVALESYPQLTAATVEMFMLQHREGATFLPTFGLKEEVNFLYGYQQTIQPEKSPFLHEVAESLSEDLKSKLVEVAQQSRQEAQQKVEDSIKTSQELIEQVTTGSEKLMSVEKELETMKRSIEITQEDIKELERNQREHSYIQPGLFNKGKLAKEQQEMLADIEQRKAELADNEQKLSELQEKLRLTLVEVDISVGMTKENLIERHTKSIEQLKSIHYL